MKSDEIIYNALIGLFWLAAMFCLIFAISCGGRPYVQTEPERIVWEEAYRAAGFSPPHVLFVKGEPCPYKLDVMAMILSCDNTVQPCHDNKECVSGLTYLGSQTYVVESSVMHVGSLAHELFHSYLNDTTGDGDPEHKNALWPTAIPAANQLLQDRGF